MRAYNLAEAELSKDQAPNPTLRTFPASPVTEDYLAGEKPHSLARLSRNLIHIWSKTFENGAFVEARCLRFRCLAWIPSQ